MTSIDQAEPPVATASLAASAARNATIVLVGISFLHNLDRTVMSGLLEPVKQAFGLSDGAVGALSGAAFGLAYAVLGLPLARLADTVNRRRLLALALGVWSALTVCCGFATGFWVFFAARFGVAVCEAAGAPAMYALVADSVPAARRSGATSLLTLGATFGAIVGVSAGGIIADHYGWNAAFWLAGAPGLLLTPFALRCLVEPRAAAGPLKLGQVFGSAMRRSCLAMFGNRALLSLLGGAALMAFWLYGTGTWFTTFLVREHHMSLSGAALSYGLLSGGTTVIGVALGGFLGDRLIPLSPRWHGRLPAACLVLTFAFAVPVYLVHDAALSLGLYMIANIFFGAILPTAYAATYALTGSRDRALGVAVLNFFNYLVGLGIAPMVVGLVSDHLAPSLHSHSLKVSLLLATISLPLSALLWLLSAARFERDMQPD